MASLAAVNDVLHLLADPTRIRLMRLLVERELSVADLVAITGLPQSRVSTHLGKLRDAGLVRDRRVGSFSLYAMCDGSMPEPAGRVWQLLGTEVDDEVLEGDRRRMLELQSEAGNDSWFDGIAGEMERHYSPGRTWEATAQGLLGFVRLGDVLDLGAGDGAIAQLLAPRSSSVTCVDINPRLLEAARLRLGQMPNVRFTLGDMHELGLSAESFDAVLLFNVLTYAREPLRVLREVHRVLRPGGIVSIVTLHTHSQLDVTRAYGHVRDGFSVDELKGLLSSSKLRTESCLIGLRERSKPYFEVVHATATKAPSDFAA